MTGGPGFASVVVQREAAHGRRPRESGRLLVDRPREHKDHSVYAAGEDAPATHAVRHLDRTLEVLALDVAGTPDQILAEMKLVASRVLRQRTHYKGESIRAA